jgi:hypothetical protein
MVPEETTRTLLDGEAAAIEAWAARHGWSVEIDAVRLALAATVRHPADGSLLLIVADLHGYRAVPPAWRFVDPRTGQSGQSAFPAAGSLPGGKGSIFHSNAVLCAPWNRLAYQSEGGPHGDWAELANWLNVPGDVTRAGNIAEMLSAINVHLGHSPGRLG